MRRGIGKNRVILSLLFAAWLIFNGILLARHELWRDEANVWLLARDLSPLGLLEQIKWQGHPCLWYFLVMPLAKAGLPFTSIGVLSCAVMAVTAGLFVYRAPLHAAVKALCLASPIFSYYYPVVARNYCLIALLLMLLAALYPARNDRPVLYGALTGLLVQADTIAMAAAGMLFLAWLWESVGCAVRERSARHLKRNAVGLALFPVSLILWGLQFRGVSGSAEFRFVLPTGRDEWINRCRYYADAILTRMTGFDGRGDRLLVVLFLVTGVLISWKMKKLFPMLVVTAAFVFEVVFSLAVYELHIWHHIGLCFVLLWFLWVGNAGTEGVVRAPLDRACRLSSGLLLALLSVAMFLRWNAPEEVSSLQNAWSGRYSDGVHAAAYIRENVDPGALVFMTDVAECSPVQAYLGRDYVFYYAGNMKRATYADYNADQSRRIAYEEFAARIRSDFGAPASFYLLQSPSDCIGDVPEEVREHWEVLYQSPAPTARGEEYVLYRIETDERNGG